MTVKVVLAGCGNMGYAMLSGWVRGERLDPAEVMVVEPNAELRARAAALGVGVAADVSALADGEAPALVVFAVKPQVIREVAAGYKGFAGRGTAFLSIAAGTTIATFEEVLGKDAAIIRCMPNTPAAIEDEALMDAVTAVSGSGPAYVFHFIECLTAAARDVGLPEATAKLLAMQTVLGAACLAAESSEEPGRLREQVTSPKGTTAAALDILMGEDRLKVLVGKAVEAARARSVELGK